MEGNVIQTKSFLFAVRIVKMYKYLISDKREYVISKQVLRSGTSIGANVEEAIGGQSKNDFIAKMSISYKEARETKYWIRLLCETNFLNQIESDSILYDCEELCKILSKILTSSKSINNDQLSSDN